MTTSTKLARAKASRAALTPAAAEAAAAVADELAPDTVDSGKVVHRAVVSSGGRKFLGPVTEPAKAVPPSAPSGASLRKIAVSLPDGILVTVEDAIDDLRRSNGLRVSFSSFVEVALAEFADRSDLADVLRRRGAGQRRKL